MMSSTAYRRRLDIPGLPTELDQAIAMIVALTSEVAVLRERLDTLEAVLERGHSLEPGAIEGFVPDAAGATRREGLRKALIAKVFRPLRDAAQRAAAAH